MTVFTVVSPFKVLELNTETFIKNQILTEFLLNHQKYVRLTGFLLLCLSNLINICYMEELKPEEKTKEEEEDDNGWNKRNILIFFAFFIITGMCFTWITASLDDTSELSMELESIDYTKLPHRLPPNGCVNFDRLTHDIDTYFSMLREDIAKYGKRGRIETPMGEGYDREGNPNCSNISPSLNFYLRNIVDAYNITPFLTDSICLAWEILHEGLGWGSYHVLRYTALLWDKGLEYRDPYYPSVFNDDPSTYLPSDFHEEATGENLAESMRGRVPWELPNARIRRIYGEECRWLYGIYKKPKPE